MRIASVAFVASASALSTAKRRLTRRDVGGAVALTTLAPLTARADVKIDPNSVRTTKGGAKYVVVKEGSCPLIDPSGALGSCYPAPESYITIDYTGFLPNGQVFDSTEKKGGKPLSFRLGERQVVPGIEQVVAQMKPGEEVQALLPADLAYGDKGVCTDDGECLIKPGTNLKYFIRLNRVAAAAG